MTKMIEQVLDRGEIAVLVTRVEWSADNRRKACWSMKTAPSSAVLAIAELDSLVVGQA